MNEPTSLVRLVELLGIQTHYHDARGQAHALSMDTARAVFRAMGVPGDTEDERIASIDLLQDAGWRRTIEPTVVISAQAGASPVVDINHLGPLADEPISWTLTGEGAAGTEWRGMAHPSRLPMVDRHRAAGLDVERRTLALPADLPMGYHHLEVRGRSPERLGGDQALVIVAPTECYLPPSLEHQPGIWGVASQLYSLGSRGSWGVGDLSDLARLIDVVAPLGAGVLGLNPLHALLPGAPSRISPYTPSSRAFLNVLYIDVEAVPEFAVSAAARDRYAAPAFRERLTAVRSSARIDYAGVAALKRPFLEMLYETFRSTSLEAGGVRAAAFRAFCEERGAALTMFAAHETLAEHYGTGAHGRVPWHQWPTPFRDPGSPSVAEFVRDNRTRVEFHEYLQFEAERQLAAAAGRAAQSGMSLGLYRDQALGIDPDGADAWVHQHSLAKGVALGAPPDPFNVDGQNWGLPPVNPRLIRESGFRLTIQSIRSNMRHAGAIRIDHVMGFERLFWIPHGAATAEGAYVRYPLEELIAIVALESHRARCAVVGEDLGTVPDGLRARLRSARILSSRLLYFQRTPDGAFLAPDRYPPLSHVAIGTHDLPTFAGYWRGADIDLRSRLGLLPTPEVEAEADERAERARTRVALLAALHQSGLWPGGGTVPADATPALIDAVHAFLARSSGRLLLVQMEDILGIEDQVNLPGTIDEYPNWREKLPVMLEALAADSRLRSLVRAITMVRPVQTGN